MSEVCYNHKGTHIPGCMGCAQMGHDGCTCPTKEQNAEASLRNQLTDLKARVKVLEDFHEHRREKRGE